MPETNSDPFGAPATGDGETLLPITEEGDAFDGPPPPPPPDTYPCKCIAVEHGTGKDSGIGYLKWTYQILGEGTWAGQELVDITSLSRKAAFRMQSVLRAFGVEPKGKVNIDPADFINQKVNILTKLEKYQDEDQAKVAKVLRYEQTIEQLTPF